MASTEGPDGGEKAAELFVRALEAEGVTHVFGVPGEENLDLLEALRLLDVARLDDLALTEVLPVLSRGAPRAHVEHE